VRRHPPRRNPTVTPARPRTKAQAKGLRRAHDRHQIRSTSCFVSPDTVSVVYRQTV
jgi:hypothetical protein